MELIILVMGDPWAPDLPPDTTVCPGLARLVIVTVLTWFLLVGGKEVPAGQR
ncbi:hypothetical protein ACQP2T_61270 [Nonomuraea sp. CA-143628]|uniref:hypothetical protein n=1 Tax=Nonomuraea sp. CA-143628 TaxID=3239997 RepID=UPI003D8BA890